MKKDPDIMHRASQEWAQRLTNILIMANYADAKAESLPFEDKPAAGRTNWEWLAHSIRRLVESAAKAGETNTKVEIMIIFDLCQILYSFMRVRDIDYNIDLEINAPIRQAMKAREERKNKPHEQTLLISVRKSIAKLEGKAYAKRGLAGRILPSVNRLMREAGFEDVSEDTVRRRLKNLRS